MNVLIDLWLLYFSAENKKKSSEDGKTPITYYLIDCFAKYNCNDRDVSMIEEQLDNYNKINNIINLYSRVTKAYTNQYNKSYNVEYNLMIKRPVEYHILENFIEILKNV